MKHSPLQLLRYAVPEISCSANPAFDPNKEIQGGIEQFSVEAVVKQQKPPDNFPGHAWSVEMNISQKLIEGHNFPYKFDMILAGFFVCSSTLPAEVNEERFVRVNGSSTLYGAAREFVRIVTASGPWGPILLPTVSFYQQEPNNQGDTSQTPALPGPIENMQ